MSYLKADYDRALSDYDNGLASKGETLERLGCLARAVEERDYPLEASIRYV